MGKCIAFAHKKYKENQIIEIKKLVKNTSKSYTFDKLDNHIEGITSTRQNYILDEEIYTGRVIVCCSSCMMIL